MSFVRRNRDARFDDNPYCSTCEHDIVDGKCPNGHKPKKAQFVIMQLTGEKFAIHWENAVGNEWRWARAIIDAYIPKEERFYEPIPKRWVFSRQWLAKAIELYNDNSKHYDFVGRNPPRQHFSKMTVPQQQRFRFFMKAVKGFVDTPIQCSFHYGGLLAAFNPTYGEWWYQSGEYSSDSPEEIDDAYIVTSTLSKNLDDAIIAKFDDTKWGTYIDRRRNKSVGYVYLMKAISTPPYYKIGYSKNPLKRLTQLNTKMVYDISIEHMIPTNDQAGLESQLHRRFADKRLNGEWFELSDEDVAYIKAIDSAGNVSKGAANVFIICRADGSRLATIKLAGDPIDFDDDNEIRSMHVADPKAFRARMLGEFADRHVVNEWYDLGNSDLVYIEAFAEASHE